MKILAALALGLAACATQFTGDAHFPGGPSSCDAQCASVGLRMSHFVYSGEFASSCVCQTPGGAGNAAAAVEDAATAGVEMQRQAQQSSQQSSQNR